MTIYPTKLMDGNLICRHTALALSVVAWWMAACLVALHGAKAADFQWTGPPNSLTATGEWFDPANWSPLRGGVPNSFADTATIALEARTDYEVRVGQDVQLMRLTLDSPLATLVPTGILGGRSGRTFEFETGGNLSMLRGALEGAILFQLRATSAEIAPDLRIVRSGRVGETPVIVARGPANTLTAAGAELSLNSPAISVLADNEDSQLTLAGTSGEGQFVLHDGARMTLDAARGNTAMLFGDARTGPLRVVNSGDLVVGGSLPHEGESVLAFELRQSPGGVLQVSSPTMLGTTRPGSLLVHRNSGDVLLDNETLTVEPFNLFINSEDGAVSGAGAVASTTPIANFGRWNPNVGVQGDFANEATGVLAFELRERTPGVDLDQLVVTGNLTLGGTLAVTLADGYSPQPGDAFDLILAGSVVGQFERILPPHLPDELAVHLLADGGDFSLQVTKPVPVRSDSAMPIANFSQAFGGVMPQSNWAAELANATGQPQQVVVTAAETPVVQSVQISGGPAPEATIALFIQENAMLAASGAITVGDGGQLLLSDGAEVFTQSLEIAGGSLAGGGNVVGNVHNLGLVSPGFADTGEQSIGVLTIEGDYVQGTGGILEIDVLGLAPGQYDTLNVTGELSLSGTVQLDLSEFEPNSSFSIEIDDDGIPVTEEPMCNVDGNGRCTVMTGTAIGPGLHVLYYLPGDFDEDGDIDRADLAIWQNTVGMTVPPPELHADSDNDGDVDSDDLLAVVLNFGKGAEMPMQQAAAVPEPGSLAIVLASGGLVLILVGVRRRIKESPTDCGVLRASPA